LAHAKKAKKEEKVGELKKRSGKREKQRKGAAQRETLKRGSGKKRRVRSAREGKAAAGDKDHPQGADSQKTRGVV